MQRSDQKHGAMERSEQAGDDVLRRVMSNEERRVQARGLSSQAPAVTLDAALEIVRKSARMPFRAIAVDGAGVTIARFPESLRSLQRALDRLRIVIETTAAEVKVSIANVLALKANALSPALIAASQDLQLIIDALETGSRVRRNEGLPAQLEVAQQEFRELVVRHRLHAELFARVKIKTCNPLARMMLANVALTITVAVKSVAFAIDSDARQLVGCSPRGLSGLRGEPEV
jgi:hypothetical protein